MDTHLDLALSSVSLRNGPGECPYTSCCCCCCFSRVWLCVTPQTEAHQAPPSLGVYRQEYWSGLPFPSPMHACMLSRFSRVRLCATLWTAAHQAPLSMRFSSQEYWSGLLFPSPRELLIARACSLAEFNRKIEEGQDQESDRQGVKSSESLCTYKTYPGISSV